MSDTYEPEDDDVSNIFDKPANCFFGGSVRARQLDELRHLSRWSRRILLVTGEADMGKTTLLHALSDALDPSVKYSKVSGLLAQSREDVLLGILQGFDVHIPEQYSVQLLSELLIADVEHASQAGTSSLILLDDAEQMNNEAWSLMLDIMRQPGSDNLHLVFFGTEQMTDKIAEFGGSDHHSRFWHTIKLVPFGQEETRRYLITRMRSTGSNQDVMFTGIQIDEIYKLSGGIPGKINFAASAILKQLDEEDAPKGTKLHFYFLFATILATVLIWIALDRKIPDPELTTEVVTVPSREQNTMEQEMQDQQAPAIEEPIVQDVELQETEAPETKTPETEEQEIEPRLVDVPQPETQKSEPQIAQERAQISIYKNEDLPPAGGTVGLDVPGYQADWISQQNSDFYTLQLFGTSRFVNVQKYLVTRLEAEPDSPFASFKMQRDGKAWYVVLHGAYANASDARQAALAIAPATGVGKPWVRKFSAIQPQLPD